MVDLKDVEMDEDLKQLWEKLVRLHHEIRKYTSKTYQRINPFYEDLFSWKERGSYWVNKESDITVYNSTTIVGDVKIGEHTWIGPFCSLDGTGGLTIGRHCSITAGVQILTHDTVKWALSSGSYGKEFSPITIGDNCFLGTTSIVVKGVSIGDHSVIAAGAVVIKDVPSHSIAAGNPAKVIGHVKMNSDNTISFEY